MKPTLYIVPTPIGNLKDITIRALDVLREVDLIACEDTRHTIKLLNHYDIKKPLISYEKFSEAKKVSYVIEQLESGKNVALVSDAGTPLVSDPGSVLINRVREKGFRIETLPGPSAIITALSASGFEGPFRFIGFFPRQAGTRKHELLRIRVSPENTVFFESPHRIRKTLVDIEQALGDRQMCLARELSKIHEEYIIGPASLIGARLAEMDSIGEITAIIKGADQADAVDETSMRIRVQDLLRSGYSRKDILSVLSQETGIKRNALYELILKID